MGQDAFFFQCLLYLVVNGTYLALTLTTADNEVAGEATNLTDVQQDDI